MTIPLAAGTANVYGTLAGTNYNVRDPSYVTVANGIASDQLLPEPSTFVIGSADAGDTIYASANVTWHVQITGYTTGASVPVDLSGSAQATATGKGQAGNGVGHGVVGYPTLDVSDLLCGIGAGESVCPAAYFLTLQLLAGTAYDNFILISSGGSSNGLGSFSASNDSTIQIDPTFAANHPGIAVV